VDHGASTAHCYSTWHHTSLEGQLFRCVSMLKLWEEGPQAYVRHLTSQNNFWLKSPLLGPDITSYIPTLALPRSLLPSRHLFISREAISQCQWTSLCDNVIWFHSSLQKKKKQSNFPTLGSRLLSQILISPAKVTILCFFFYYGYPGFFQFHYLYWYY